MTTSSSQPLDQVIKDRSSVKALTLLALKLKRGSITGPEQIATATAKALRSVVSAAKFSSLDELIKIIRAAGKYLQQAQVREQTIGNITRRVLHLLREEARAAQLEAQPVTPSMSSSTTFQSPQPLSPVGRHAFNRSSTSTSSHQQTSSSSSYTTTAGRPQLSAFRPGSTFSISDLVAAGASASAGSSSFATPLNSGSNTPGWGSASIEGLGYGVERLHMHHEGQEDESDSEEASDTEEEDADDDDDDDEDDDSSDAESDAAAAAHSSKKKRGAGVYQLKPLLIQAIQELIDELDTVDSNIAKDARDHIHSGEVIFTLGYSQTVEAFLKAASKDRKFTVIVAECAPTYSGHTLAKALSSAGISTLLVPDSSTFTLMPRISKILLGAHCILANGGLLACAGSRMVAEAARAHSTPTVVLAGVYKVCPDWAWVGVGTSLVNKSGMSVSQGLTCSNEGSPLDVVSFDEEGADQVEIVNPIWDYVDPDHIDLLITNAGEHPVSLVYRLLSENYDGQDLVL